MRFTVALALLLVSAGAVAEENWVAVRRPSDPGQAGTPTILVDTTSIEILDSGLRRARSKFDWLDGRKIETPSSTTLVMMILLRVYDCDKRMTQEIRNEFYDSDGSHQSIDRGGNWYPAPDNKLAEPTLDFVCGWVLEKNQR